MKIEDQNFTQPNTSEIESGKETQIEWLNELVSDCEKVDEFAKSQLEAEYASSVKFDSILNSIKNRFQNPSFSIDQVTAHRCFKILSEAHEISKDHPANPNKLFVNAIEAIENYK